MKKKHARLRLSKMAIASLNDLMLPGIRGGNELMLLHSKLNYCSAIRDTATGPTDTNPSVNARCKDTGNNCTAGKA